MNSEVSNNPTNPVGLYKNPDTGVYLGVLDPAQGDAVVRQGFRLVKEGSEAATMTEKEIAAALKKQTEVATPDAGDENQGGE